MILQHDSSSSSHHEALPAERFFWAVLDARSFGKKRITQRQLGYLFESVLPIPIDQVHAVFAKTMALPDQVRKYLACGMRTDELEKEIAHRIGCLTLAPASFPSFVQETLDSVHLEPQSLNLLVGRFEPAAVNSLKGTWFRHLAIAAVLATLLVAGGLERRVAAAARQLADLQQARTNLLNQISGPGPGSAGQPPEMRLMVELRTLRATRKQPIGELQTGDATTVLAQLLAHWPSDLHVQTESLLVSPESITLRARADNSTDVQNLANALRNVGDQWRLQQPQINADKDAVQATIQIKQVKESSK